MKKEIKEICYNEDCSLTEARELYKIRKKNENKKNNSNADS